MQEEIVLNRLLTIYVLKVQLLPLLQIMSILFGLVMTGPAPLTNQYIPLEQWEAQAGDRFIADTEENTGYIVHESGNYTSMRIGSGKRKVVRYIGKVYDATTPSAYWEVQSTNTYGDRITFGKTGRFMRLYADDKSTSYGIHATANIDDILASDDRYKSMGCILVSDAVLDILEETYELNGNSLQVVTTMGIDDALMIHQAEY